MLQFSFLKFLNLLIVIHVDGNVNPVSDKEIIDLELQLKDLETLEKRIGAIERKAKSGDKE
ncbi:MAG: hypothetical protein P8I02_01900, partial [Flavobacteriales bacterium]|nr:hypothetical protein [Flavobacteriales bacterium]